MKIKWILSYSCYPFPLEKTTKTPSFFLLHTAASNLQNSVSNSPTSPHAHGLSLACLGNIFFLPTGYGYTRATLFFLVAWQQFFGNKRVLLKNCANRAAFYHMKNKEIVVNNTRWKFSLFFSFHPFPGEHLFAPWAYHARTWYFLGQKCRFFLFEIEYKCTMWYYILLYYSIDLFP